MSTPPAEPAFDPRVYMLVRRTARLILAPGFRLRVSGAEHLPDDSAFVLLPKHQRWQDIPLLGLSITRPLYYVAKQELFSFTAFEWLFKRIGGIPLNRDRPMESRRYLNRTVELLHRGEGLVVFPEGTYYRGRMGPGKVGMTRFILSRLSLPFIPVGIEYRRSGLRVNADIRFGKRIRPVENEPADRFVARIMADIAALSGMAPPPY